MTTDTVFYTKPTGTVIEVRDIPENRELAESLGWKQGLGEDEEPAVHKINPNEVTEEMLRELVEKHGFKSLRESTKHLDITARSADDLIAAILELQTQ